MNKKSYINRVAHYHPDGVIDNSLFENHLDTTSEWIESRVGIRTRRFLDDYTGDFPVFELCKRVVLKLQEDGNWNADNVDLIISCSSLDDLSYPGPANMISEFLGRDVPAFHLKNACSSVVYAIEVARSMLQSGRYREILIVNGEPFTRHADYGDRNSCILFGDGASALVLSANPSGFEILDCEIGGKGLMLVSSTRTSETSHISVTDFVSGEVNGPQNSYKKFEQDGRQVFKFVLKNLPGPILAFMERNGESNQSINYAIFHQANLLMMNSLCERVGISSEKHLYNIDQFGNTSSAGWVTVLSEAEKLSKFKQEENVLVSVMGGGMTWGNLLLRRI